MKSCLAGWWLSIFLLGHQPFYAQNHDFNWLFGTYGGSIKHEWGGMNLDFHNRPPDTIWVDRPISTIDHFHNTSISDSSGKLVLYTDGCSVYNWKDEIIEGGDTLNVNDDFRHKQWCFEDGGMVNGFPRLSDLIFIPLPDTSNVYVLIHRSEHRNPTGTPQYQFICKTLDLAYIDMNANNGEGKLTHRKTILSDSLNWMEANACKHQNGKDWWTIASKSYSNRFFSFLIKKDSVLGPFVTEIGEAIDTGAEVDQACFSPDGKHFAKVNGRNGLMLYDFDRETGELSNFRSFKRGDYMNPNDSISLQGVAFSPNSKYVYVAGWWEMYQLEVDAPVLDSSMIIVGVYDKFWAGNSDYPLFSCLQAGPDCKIYGSNRRFGRYLHVIHSPDEKGIACDLRRHDLYLPVYHGEYMPNFPYYRLGSNQPICDSTVAVSGWNLSELPAKTVQAWPNPFSETIQFQLENKSDNGEKVFQLFDAFGRLVRQEKFQGNSIRINRQGLPAGFLFFKITASNGRLIGAGKVVAE